MSVPIVLWYGLMSQEVQTNMRIFPPTLLDSLHPFKCLGLGLVGIVLNGLLGVKTLFIKKNQGSGKVKALTYISFRIPCIDLKSKISNHQAYKYKP